MGKKATNKQTPHSGCWLLKNDLVRLFDGKNPAPPGMLKTLYMMGYSTSQQQVDIMVHTFLQLGLPDAWHSPPLHEHFA